MPAATNPAAIPKGLLSPCQLNCLCMSPPLPFSGITKLTRNLLQMTVNVLLWQQPGSLPFCKRMCLSTNTSVMIPRLLASVSLRSPSPTCNSSPNPLLSYISDLQLCVQCLADALYLANQENPRSQHTHRIPDIYGLNGLEAQLTDGIASWCENGTDSAESLEEFLCLGREITQRFGGPTVVSLLSLTFSFPSLLPPSSLFQALSF
jgi:hypothetical protein